MADRPGKAPCPPGRADRMFVAVDRSLRSIEAGQMRKIRALTENAYRTADTISSALGNIGLSVNVNFGGNADGGSLIATVPGQFDAKLDRLDEALGTLDAIKANTRLLPITNPLPGSTVTSPYGKRRDPILHRPAMHSGTDFRAPSGAPVARKSGRRRNRLSRRLERQSRQFGPANRVAFTLRGPSPRHAGQSEQVSCRRQKTCQSTLENICKLM